MNRYRLNRGGDRAAQLATDGGQLAEIVAGIGRGEVARGRYDEAVTALRAGVDRSPNDATLWRVLGQAYSAATRHRAAAFSYRRAWRLDGSVPHALGLSEQLLLAGQKDEALAFLNDPKIRDLGDDELDHNRTLAGGDGGGDAGDGSTRTELPPWPELWLGRGWIMRIAGLVLLALIVLAIIPYVFHVEERSGFGWLQPDRSDLASAVGLLVLVALLVLPYGLKFKAPGIEIEAGPSGPSPERPEPKLEAIPARTLGPIGPG